jgi:hypothetical protein
MVAQRNPQYFLRLLSNDNRYRRRESMLFPVTVGLSHLMPSTERNTILNY